MTTGRRGRPRLADVDAAHRKSDEILAAARELFAEKGFERTTMRGIAQRAGVDPALIHHYFGNKNRLMVAALRPDIDVAEVFAGFDPDTPSPGAELVRRGIGLWDGNPEFRTRMVGVLRIAMTHHEVAVALRELFLGFAGQALGDLAKPDRRDTRIALVASQMLGLAMARYILEVPPIATLTLDELADHVGPRIEEYLLGDLSTPITGRLLS
ncbi:TetR/AcrR family transcriptional regulator [Gordonia sp. NPDC003424]